MRSMTLLTVAMVVAACAGQPAKQATQPSTAATAPAAAPAPAAASKPYNSPSGADRPTAEVEAQRLAAAKNLNLKVINKDGQELFCRSNLVTGSHISRDTRCYTADQLEKMQEQTQRDLETNYLRPAYSTTPGKGILSQ